MVGLQVERILDFKDKVGEGAVWDDRDNLLWRVDIPAGLIHALNPADGAAESYDFGEPVGCLAIREGGGLVVAAKSGFWFYDPGSGARQQISDPEAGQPLSRFNDGATDSMGRFWAGRVREGGGEVPHGRFYRLNRDGSVTPWIGDIFTPNGMAFSPDGRTMYYSDSSPKDPHGLGRRLRP